MTPDPLDSILERSAPATSEADASDLRAMIASARAQVRRPRRRRLGIVAGALALALAGGASFAAASSSWDWNAGMNPNRSHTYTSPTWGECELRVGNIVAANPLRQFELDRAIDDWFATADVAAEVEPYIAGHLAVLEGDQSDATDPRSADAYYWVAVDEALGDAMSAGLSERGFDNASISTGSGQVHCEGEQWK
ncbi:hypothetical protein [Microbacterium oleivorans]|uniref:hypothetical protein n=1 Tax=Microbacterium oleivorans TaxID=273677 RepID=UPI00080E7F36|nr:hypothetical protein [Microbacterium oleivorans]